MRAKRKISNQAMKKATISVGIIIAIIAGAVTYLTASGTLANWVNGNDCPSIQSVGL